MKRKKLLVELIQRDDEVLARNRRDEVTVKDYVEIYRRTGNMPLPVVFFDKETYWLADGCQRIEAQIDCGEKEIMCEIHDGTKAEAAWYAIGANREHGLRLTNAEKRHAAQVGVKMAGEKSDHAIADQAGVSVGVVTRERGKMTEPPLILKISGDADEPRVVETKTGKKMDVSKIGSKSKGRAGRRTKAQQAAREAQVFKDGLGQSIPDRLRAVAEDTTLIDTALTGISDWMKTVEKLAALPSGAGRHIDPKQVAGYVQEARKHLLDAKFYCACPQCCEKKAKAPASCRCKGEGWYTRAGYNRKYLA